MRIAVISDIHGNLPALDAVLTDIKERGTDLTVNLGDCVTSPLWPKETFEVLQSLALPRRTKVRLLSVVEPLRFPTTAPGGAVRGQLLRMLKELEAERRGELEKVLERAAAQLDDKLTRVTRSTPTGAPADEIVAAANDYDTDLVVVGARGRGGMARLLLGSVSEKVLRDARCPVLIVKERSKP